MRRVDRETIVVEKDGVTARLPMSMYAAEELGRGVILRRHLRDWYYQQAKNGGPGNGHSLMLAIDTETSRFYMQIPMNASAGDIVSNVQFLDHPSFKPLPSDRAEALQDGSYFPTICELVREIGMELAVAHERSRSLPLSSPGEWMASREAVEWGCAPMDGMIARLTEGDVSEPMLCNTHVASQPDDSKPVDDIIFGLVASIRNPETCKSATDALNQAFAAIFSGPAPAGDLRVEHVDLLCDAFAHRLSLDGEDPEAAAGMATIPFFRTISAKYDTILVREALGIDLLSDAGCERIAALMRFDLEGNAKKAGVPAQVASGVRNHIGASLDNMISEAAQTSRFVIAGKAPEAGYFFSGSRNPEAPSIFLRHAARAMMTFGGIAGPHNAAAVRLAEGYGSAADPSWDFEGRTPKLSDLAPIHTPVAETPRRVSPAPRASSPSP